MLIDVAEARLRIKDGTAVLVDIREPHEWRAGHVAEAVNLPMSGSPVDALEPTVDYMIICRSGGRSAKTVAALTTAGFSVVDVAGGMLAWEEADLPMQSHAEYPPTVIAP